MADTARPEITKDKAFTSAIKRFIIVGNPNVGKSVLFGRLANKYVTVSNYPGTTVTVTFPAERIL